MSNAHDYTQPLGLGHLPLIAPVPAGMAQEQLVDIDLNGADPSMLDPVSGVLEIPTADGGVLVDFKPEQDEKPNKFGDNLALIMGERELGVIAEDLLQGIKADDDSRAEWLATIERGIDLLGFKLEEPRGDIGSSSAPLEGMAVVRHPVLAEAVLRSQATACGELLPAAGPVKVRDDNDVTVQSTTLAEALEKDFNHYLTVDAPEYYPDTRRALFWSSLTGSSFKKVNSCPLRRRPVSETVDAKDLIVSSSATDLANAARVTHQILMRPSLMRRMQLMEVYRDVPLTQPHREPNRVEEKQANIDGLQLRQDRPEDEPYTVYECYCELDINQFAPRQFKGKKLPLPYRVSIEKDTRVVLDIRRNWDEDDKQCLPKRCFVKYPYIEGMGLYGIGLLHILGNGDTALTAAWRLMLDNGMFSNFPGGLIDKAASRQNSNEFRAGPGSFLPVDTGGGDIRTKVMPLPYKPLDGVFVQFIASVQEIMQRLGGAAEIAVGDGRQDAPVGTTLALIEQACKIMSEVHKGLHTAQSEEFRLLKERFGDDPSALWRHNKRSQTLAVFAQQWPEVAQAAAEQEAAEEQRKKLFVAALNDHSLVPQADPNTPSHTHRILKWQGLNQIAAGNPNIDRDAVDKIGIRTLGFDPAGLFKPAQPAMPQEDPMMVAAKARMIDAQTNAQVKPIEAQVKAAMAGATLQQKQREVESKEKIAQLNVQRELIIHQNDRADADRKFAIEQQQKHADRVVDHVHRSADRAVDQHNNNVDRTIDNQHRHADRALDHHHRQADRAAGFMSEQLARQERQQQPKKEGE